MNKNILNYMDTILIIYFQFIQALSSENSEMSGFSGILVKYMRLYQPPDFYDISRSMQSVYIVTEKLYNPLFSPKCIPMPE